MENKSIGKFISTLRKASGMTQKDLGDKLFVSDKTISRWEREESAPEISLLPAIAEVFGITVDELLHGERNIFDVEEKVEAIEPKEESIPQIKSKTSAINKPLLIKLFAIFGINENCLTGSIRPTETIVNKSSLNLESKQGSCNKIFIRSKSIKLYIYNDLDFNVGYRSTNFFNVYCETQTILWNLL